MYVFEAIQYPFKSQGWIGKAFVGALLLLIPIVNIFGAIVLAGYMMRIIREVRAGNETLPEMDFVADFMRGLVLVLGNILYQIPVFIISFLLGAVFGRSDGGLVIGSLVSMVISVVVGAVLLVAHVRYALTEDFNAYLQVSDNIAIARDNIGALLMYVLNAIVFALVASIAVTIGLFLLIIPGLLVAAMMVFASGYMLARVSEDLGLSGGKIKAKNFA